MIRILSVLLLMLGCLIHSKLLYTLSIIRHGAAYPSNDLYDGSETKEFWGQLTNIGLRQQFLLGSYLKQTYIAEQELTTPKYNPNQVEFYSTSYDRTWNSALAFAFGFYPLGEGWRIPQEVPSDKLDPPFEVLRRDNLVILEGKEQLPFGLKDGFQPVPIYPIDALLDNCPNWGVLITNRYKEIAQPVATLQAQQTLEIAKMKLVFNLTAVQSTVATISDLYDTIVADQYLGRPLPKDYNDNDEKTVRYISEYYNSLVYSETFARIISTPSFRFIRERFDSVIRKVSTKHMSFVLGHSSNLYPLMTLLNLTSPDCLTQKFKGQPVTTLNCLAPPRYAANLILELYEDDTYQHFVQLKYNGEYAYLCETKQIRCKYEDFVGRLANL